MEQDVAWLDVAVSDPRFVQGVRGPGSVGHRGERDLLCYRLSRVRK